MGNPLRGLAAAGQAVWLDYLHRRILADGELARLIETDGVTGLTSNPAIFQKAIGGGGDYDQALAGLVDQRDGEVVGLYERLAIGDIQAAADQLRPLWQSLGGRDGFVSLEVSPYLAHDTDGTMAEARRLWRAVDRPNVMIKVPGTAAGVPAIQTLIAEGINVNVTLLFSVEAYLAVAEAHMAGLEARLAGGGDVSTTHGVASVFVSRIDAAVDSVIDQRAPNADPDEAQALRRLRGKVAIANARVAYGRYQAMIGTPRWKTLAEAGAAPQRLLWASTGAKDPSYSDVLYVEALIGPDTVDTMPPATLAAFRDHGTVEQTLAGHLDESEAVLADADQLGIDLPAITAQLTREGVESFASAFDELLGAVGAKRREALGSRLNGQTIWAGDLKPAMTDTLARAAREGWTRRLWDGDAALWTGADESRWLGWLDAAAGAAVDLQALGNLTEAIRGRGFAHVVLLGMGGSSLCPEVLAGLFPSAPGLPALLVLDSTHPAQVARIASSIEPAKTLFIVSSKSGSTLESDLLRRFFFAFVQSAVGPEHAGRHFIAITDPGSSLEAVASTDRFWMTLHGRPTIGGRYSALSNFGMAPAAAIGLEAGRIFEIVAPMARSCGPSAPPKVNPGFELGIFMGVAALRGRDKLTIFASEDLAPLVPWLEQLIAESTGKSGQGLIPIDGEPPRPASAYGADRVFISLALAGAQESAADARLHALEALGHPVARITLSGPEMVFQEFFRFEVATAVAGAVLGINPFDQPDVEASKLKTRAITENAGGGPPEFAAPLATFGHLRLFADQLNRARLAALTNESSLTGLLKAHLRSAGVHDYLALLAYLDREDSIGRRLQSIRRLLGEAAPVATVLQYGPRFLHSTGQAYKGGPNEGVFLQITSLPANELAVPGQGLAFGAVVAAQAEGDLQAMSERGRRIIRVDLGCDVAAGLNELETAVIEALA